MNNQIIIDEQKRKADKKAADAAAAAAWAKTARYQPSQYDETPNFNKNIQDHYDDVLANRRKMFQANRDRAIQSVNTQSQGAADAISRRFAALGQTGSGANIAANLKQNEITQNSTNHANAGVDQQELQAAEGDLARAWDQIQRDIQQNQFKTQFDADEAFKARQLELAQKQFEMDAATTEFNKGMSQAEFDRGPAGLFGSGGVLGTGIGKKG